MTPWEWFEVGFYGALGVGVALLVMLAASLVVAAVVGFVLGATGLWNDRWFR